MKITANITDEFIAIGIILFSSSSIFETLGFVFIKNIRSQKIKVLGATFLNKSFDFKYSSQEIRELNRK